MSLLGGKELGRREESNVGFGVAIWACGGLAVVVVVVEAVESAGGVEASEGVYAYVGA